MPQFQCIHCGQLIDAEAAFAGMEADCPTCERTVMVPSLAKYEAPPRIPRPATVPAASTFQEPTVPVHASFPEPELMPMPEAGLDIVSQFRSESGATVPPPSSSSSSQPTPRLAPSGVPMHSVPYREDEMLDPTLEGRGGKRKRTKASEGRLWQPVVAVTVAAVISLIFWLWHRSSQRPGTTDAITQDKPVASPARIPSSPTVAIPLPSSLTLTQCSERDLAAMMTAMGLPYEDQAWLDPVWRKNLSAMRAAVILELSKLGAEGMDRFLMPERIAADQDLRSSYVMLDKMDEHDRNIAAQIKELTQSFADEITGRFSMTAAGYAGQFNPGHSISYYLTLLHAFFQQQRRLMDFVRDNRGSWTVQAGRFDFTSAALDRNYLELLDQLQDIAGSIDFMVERPAKAPSWTRIDALVPPGSLTIDGLQRRELAAMQTALKLPAAEAQDLEKRWHESEKLQEDAMASGLAQVSAQELNELFESGRLLADRDMARSYAILNDIDWRDRAVVQKIKALGKDFQDQLMMWGGTRLPPDWSRFNPQNVRLIYMEAVVDVNKKSREIINFRGSCQGRMELNGRSIRFQDPAEAQRDQQLWAEWRQIRARADRMAQRVAPPPPANPNDFVPASAGVIAQRKMLTPHGNPEPIFQTLNLSEEDRRWMMSEWRFYQSTSLEVIDKARQREKKTLNRVFEPTRVFTDERYEESNAMVRDLNLIWLTADRETQALVNSTKRNLDMRLGDREPGLFRGFTHEAIFGEFFKMQRVRISKLEEIFRFLKFHSWQPRGSQFVFANPKEDEQLMNLFREYADLEKALLQQGM